MSRSRFRKAVMQTFGAECNTEPQRYNSGRTANPCRMIPNTGGSLGCAISEAVEKAVTTDGCRYVLGSVLNQVLLHQSIIGLESKTAMDFLGEYPDVVIGCAGGGSNLGGLIAPYMQDKLTGKGNPRIVAVEPASCPSFTRGKYAYDFCDTGKITPDGENVYFGMRLYSVCKPCRRTSVSRDVPDFIQAVS